LKLPAEPDCKHFVEMAVAAGRSLTSPVTGWIHTHPHADETGQLQAVPLYENFLFALALLRTCTLESMTEARGIIEKILPFQTPEGLFPVYLHEYPKVSDLYFSATLMPLFVYFLRDHSIALGSELTEKLKGVMEKLLAASTFEHIKLTASKVALGQKLSMPPLSSTIDGLIAGQLIDHLPELTSSWHDPTSTFMGTQKLDHQFRFEPVPTLYDLFLGYFSKRPSQRAFGGVQPFHIQAALIQHLKPDWPDRGQLPFWIQTEPHFKFVWGAPSRVHTLVCPKKAEVLMKGARQVEIMLPVEPEEDVSFFLDQQKEGRFTVEGLPALVFLPGQELKLETEDESFKWSFTCEGDVSGHHLRGNRPGQLATRGLERFTAFDWQIQFRVHRCSPGARLRILCTFG